MPKRSTSKRGNSRSRTKTAPKKTPATKGKGKAKASIASSAKSDDGKSERANSVTASDDDDDDVEELNNKTSPGSKDSPDLDDIPIYSVRDVTIIICRILGEEHYGFEHKYNDEDTSHIPPNAEQRRRNGRQTGRDLIIWNRKKFWNKQIRNYFTKLLFWTSFLFYFFFSIFWTSFSTH